MTGEFLSEESWTVAVPAGSFGVTIPEYFGFEEFIGPIPGHGRHHIPYFAGHGPILNAHLHPREV